MKKIFAITFVQIILSSILTSCDYIGTTAVKSLIDLSPKLEAENNKNFKLPKADRKLVLNNKSYNISKNKIVAEPVIAKNVIYSLDSKNNITAFSLKDKKTLWSRNIAKNNKQNDSAIGGLLFSDDKIYVTNNTRDLIVLDSLTGHEIIRKEFPDILRLKPLMIDEKLLVLQTVSNQLISYDTDSSTLVWMHDGGLETISKQNQSNPISHNGNVIASYSSGEVVYIDGKTGAAKWHYALNNPNDVKLPSFDPNVVVEKPVISDNHGYFATSNDKLVKIDLDSGQEIWSKNAYDLQSISLIGNYLFVTNNSRQVAAISTKDSTVAWVGNLISDKERGFKRPKPIISQAPFLSMNEKNITTLNVIASNGEVYQFSEDDSGNISPTPTISYIAKDVKYHNISCCSDVVRTIGERSINF